MAILRENLDDFDAALAEMEAKVRVARRVTQRVREALQTLEADPGSAEETRGLGLITGPASELKQSVNKAEAVFLATEPVDQSGG